MGHHSVGLTVLRNHTSSATVVHAQEALRAETDDPFLWAPHAFFGDWR